MSGVLVARLAALVFTLGAVALLWRLVRRPLRKALRRALRPVLTRTARRTLWRFRARVDRFKLIRHRDVRDALVADPTLRRTLADTAEQDEDPDLRFIPSDVEARVDHYLREIIPRFSVLSYFRIGYVLARLVVRALYFVDVDPADMDRLSALLKDRNRTVLFLINHRSNMDFVLLALVFAQRVALSYAVGEWARVWPLEPLFKSFGSYFIRRGERDPHYHAVLSRYVQYVTAHGVTQGVFPEGGLSRDGALRPAKVGLLDSMVQAKADAGFQRELLIVPVSITYDRVLEDETLMLEAFGSRPAVWERRRLLRKQARSVARYLFSQVHLFVLERQRKFGNAAVRVGQPISVDAWLRENPGWLTMDRAVRKPALQGLADRVMAEISRNLCVLPAPVLASVLHERRALPVDEARALFEARVADVRGRGARMWVGHRRVKDPFRMALTMFQRRGVVTVVEGALVVREDARALMEYYARGLAPWWTASEGVLSLAKAAASTGTQEKSA